MPTFADQRDAYVADALKEQWDRTVLAWSQQSHHDELLRLITQHDAYAWGAARYREELETRGTDDTAARQIERLKKSAEVTLFAQRAPRPEPATTAYRTTFAVLLVLVVAAIALVIYGWFVDRDAAPDPTLVPPASAVQPTVK